MIPELTAEEALHNVSVIAVGSGMARKSDAQRIRAAWRREANVQGRRIMLTEPGAVPSMDIGLEVQKVVVKDG